MKITCISDTHNQHYKIPPKYLLGGDCIIHSGDMGMIGSRAEMEDFLMWFNELPYTYKILIAGNHDIFFEQAPEYEIDKVLKRYNKIIYLNDSGVEIEGLKFWGSPVQPAFMNWAFNRDEDDIKYHWDMIPLDTQILIVHGPAYGYLDFIHGDKVGCPFLSEKIKKIDKLKLFVFGHIHDGYGRIDLSDGKIFVNASVLSEDYIMKNPPIYLEL